jgi:hypothetical protein
MFVVDCLSGGYMLMQLANAKSFRLGCIAFVFLLADMAFAIFFLIMAVGLHS